MRARPAGGAADGTELREGEAPRGTEGESAERPPRTRTALPSALTPYFLPYGPRGASKPDGARSSWFTGPGRGRARGAALAVRLSSLHEHDPVRRQTTEIVDSTGRLGTQHQTTANSPLTCRVSLSSCSRCPVSCDLHLILALAARSLATTECDEKRREEEVNAAEDAQREALACWAAGAAIGDHR